MGKHIIYITDMNMGGANSADDAIPRSGYANIGIELCRGLVKHGYDVKVLGIGYTGQEHNEPFSIIPCNNLQGTAGYVSNLKYLWGVDAVVVALDIHRFQESLIQPIKQLELKYICITPLESDPLCPTWANLLSQMDKVFFISQLGADEAQKAGVEAEHIEIGIDTKAWKLRTEEEYQQIRKSLGIEPDEFVILTVADNQERKNLGRGFQIVAGLKNLGVKVRHILVTREKSLVGWKLYDLAYTLDISSELIVFNNGIPFQDLYLLYCGADVYLSCSKGEGLGYPILEAMAVGVPVVANEAGALPELLADKRGWIVPYDNWYYDPFGNQRRYDISVDSAIAILHELKDMSTLEYTANARAFVESRTWDKPSKQLADAIEELDGV